MKVRVAPLAPPVPPETGASTEATPCFAASAWACLALSTSMVEQSMISAPLRHGRNDVGPDRQHMLAGRQHGDDDLGALHRADRAVGDPSAVGLGLIARGRHQIERDHLVAGLDQIGRHRAAHVAEADECDACHGPIPSAQPFLFCLVEHQFVGADLREIRRDHFRRHVLDPRRRPARIAVLVDHGRAHALAKIVAARILPARRDIPAPGILPARTIAAPAAAVSARPPCRAATSRSTSSASLAPAPSRPARGPRRYPAIRSWANQRSICGCSAATGPAVSPVAKPSIAAFTSAALAPARRLTSASRSAASLPEGTTASAKWA